MDGTENILEVEWPGLGGSVLWLEPLGRRRCCFLGEGSQEEDQTVSSGHTGWFQGARQPSEGECPGSYWICKLTLRSEKWMEIKTLWCVPCPAPAAGNRAVRPSCPQGAFLLVGPSDTKQENPEMNTISRRGGEWGLVQPGFCVSLQGQWDSGSASSWGS